MPLSICIMLVVSGGNHVSFIRCFGVAICRLYRCQGQDPAGSAKRKARAGRKGLVRDRCPHRREIPRGSHLRVVLPLVRLCPVRPRAHSRSGLRHLYFGDVPQGQDQALRKRLRHFFVPRRSRCRVPARRGDQSGERIFLSDRLARKSAVRQAVFAFARVFGEGAQRAAVRRSAHRRSRLLCAAKGRHFAARATNLKLLAKFMEGK